MLLTGVATYDVVWVVDSDGEFAASLPYRTVPFQRPVVGDGGLTAAGLVMPKFERFGAPQVTRRLAKAAGRPMRRHTTGRAWMAGKALVAAAVVPRRRSRPPAFAKAAGRGRSRRLQGRGR